MGHKKRPESEFVEHPRFGSTPNRTGLNVSPSDPGVHLHWHSKDSTRMPFTAIAADIEEQTLAMFPVTHYFDERRVCDDCRRPFLFYAAEQKHWYEQLGFGLDSDCVRCSPCRKRQQGVARTRQRYEELTSRDGLIASETFELAKCAIELVEREIFGDKAADKARARVNQLAGLHSADQRFLELTSRMERLAESDVPD